MPHQAIVEFIAAVTRPLAGAGPLLSEEDARREGEELSLVRSAIHAWAAYRLPWFDAHVWAYAHAYGLSEIYSEDFQHDRLYGTVRIIDPFI